ncbi:MAG TPA: Cof-type HAD-IIB family hydrolase [Candidatus Izemoplasmatales bacterium]|nr:Cof-type HAD-IIB family hydrolase [Candidatus Izemoplasmatales bacterium]
MIRLVAMDLDGTLFNQHQKISPRNLQAIEALKASDRYVVIASGRTHEDIAALVRPLGLDSYPKAFFISYNGVLTAQTFPYREYYRRTIRAADVRSIGALVEAAGLYAHIFVQDRVYLSKGIEYVIESDAERMARAERIVASEYAGEDEVFKVLVLAAPEPLDAFRAAIPSEFERRYTIFKSSTHLLEFVHKEGSKGAALAHLCGILGIPAGEVAAFGDEENDIAMLSFAGLGIAMDNAKPAVKAVAKRITASNRLDGVGEAIERYILKEE